eukprot:25551_1
MDSVSLLKSSHLRLAELTKKVENGRYELINHSYNNPNITSNSTYFPYCSLVEKYTGFADEYHRELLHFKDLLKESVKRDINNNSFGIKDVKSHLPPHILSATSSPSPSVTDDHNTAYSNNSVSSTTSREIATPNTSDTPIDDEKVSLVQLPKIQPSSAPSKQITPKAPVPTTYTKPRTTKKAQIVYRETEYKYGGTGFDVWKRNNQREMYSSTVLVCSRTFGDDKDVAGKEKLKRFLIKRGGFKKNCIESMVIRDSQFNGRNGIITVRDSIENIENGMDKINNFKDRKEDVLFYSNRRNYREWRAEKCRLFVKNFDICDHFFVFSYVFVFFAGLVKFNI